jgi:hypothetical protein
MNNSKYEFKASENSEPALFQNKAVFIEYCQTRYNDCFNSPRKYNFYFSYDTGKCSFHINEFKTHRLTIQKGVFFNEIP